MSILSDWSLPSRSRACTRCDRPFSAGMLVCTVLLHHDGTWIRHDLCPGCMDDDTPFTAAHKVSTWKTRIQESQPVTAGSRTEAGRIEQALRQCLDAPDETLRAEDCTAIAFFLATMLERKRILTELTRSEGSPAQHVYEHRATLETFTLPTPAPADPGEMKQISQAIHALIAYKADP